MKKSQEYFIGLDCGTSSVGWAVSDINYQIPKRKGNKLWGVRLFEEADTAAERRLHRSARRRLNRTKRRLKHLEMLFDEELVKVDPDFYIRLRESFYIESDKQGLAKKTKNILFDDSNFTDKDFHEKYPTIWHLRNDLMTTTEKKDIRLYFLAIHHILKNRGHFLITNPHPMKGIEASMVQDELIALRNFGIDITPGAAENIGNIIRNQAKKKSQKAEEIVTIIYDLLGESEDDETDGFDKKRIKELAKLFTGMAVNMGILFRIEGAEDAFKEDKIKYPFTKGVFEEKVDEIESLIGRDNMELVYTAKKIYDFGLLSELLKDSTTISQAMLENFDQHQKDLAALKKLLRNNHRAEFDSLIGNKESFYSRYIGKSQKEKKISQEDLNKEIEKVLEKIAYTGDLLEKAKTRTLFPKQKGQAKGTIPMQLHLAELQAILTNLKRDYPTFRESDKYINENGKEQSKIESLLTFRIPYYVGPLVKRKFNQSSDPRDKNNSQKVVAGGKSEFSWGEEDINEIIYPWNFSKLINQNERANNFIRQMTNFCTYLIGEEVLPKCSPIYQKYTVLEALNNLKINGMRIPDVKLKKTIYEKVFVDGEITGNVTAKKLAKWLNDNRLVIEPVEISGIGGEAGNTSIKAELSTENDFRAILGSSYSKYPIDKINQCVEVITILGEEKQMAAKKIKDILSCTDAQALELAKKNYTGWAKFSNKLLMGIKADNGRGSQWSILEAMMETNQNFMELVALSESKYQKAIDDFNQPKQTELNGRISYELVDELYCSPSIKRSAWQTLKIVRELINSLEEVPKKIFIETARDDNEKNDKKRTLSRHKKLLEIYTKIKSEEGRSIIAQLGSFKDRDLQNKKLYLYFTQMCRCAYSGSPIDINLLMTSAYDIDHIYPKSKTKDDSITRNLVLVKAELNREKTNTYPISADIRTKMAANWSHWHKAGLITKEKYERLIRPTELTTEELGDFIARQLVETRQSTKAIAELLKKIYPETEIVYSKAGQVDDFRQMFNGEDVYEWKNVGKTEPKNQAKWQLKNDQANGKAGDWFEKVYKSTKPSWAVKLRELNDLHHAKDAYLNIVVGNVYHTRFTSNPHRWVKNWANSGKTLDGDKSYTLKPQFIFSANDKRSFNEAWQGQSTIEVVKNTMERNDILLTRHSFIKKGAISAANIVSKVGILPIKNDPRLQNTKQYGGYNQLTGAFYCLVEQNDKHKARILEQVPIIHQNQVEEYINAKHTNARIIIKRIPIKSYLKIDGFPLYATGGKDFISGVEIIFDSQTVKYIKKVLNVRRKMGNDKNKNGYKVNEMFDNVSVSENIKLYEKFTAKMSKALKYKPSMEKTIKAVSNGLEKFKLLSIEEQCVILGRIVSLLACSPSREDLSVIGGTKEEGRGRLNLNLSKYKSVELIYQSPTGLFEKTINLKTVK